VDPVGVEIHDARESGLVQHRVVERDVPLENGPAANDLGFQHHAFADAVLAGKNLLQDRIDFILRNGRQESQAAEIDGQDGNAAIRRKACCGEQSSVTAQHNQEVGARRELLALPHLAGERADAIGRLGIADDSRAVSLQPVGERRHDARDIFAAGTGNDSYCFDHRDFFGSTAKAISTLAFVAWFHFDEFSRDCDGPRE